MKVKNSKEILEYCRKFDKKVFGFGYKPDFYNRFEWVTDERLERYIKRFDMEVGLVRLGGDVGLHRDKGVSRKGLIVCLKDFTFEEGGKLFKLKSGDVVDHDGGLPHRGWDCFCLVMWNKMKSVKKCEERRQLQLF
jgi:hypothetical protein